MESLIGRALGQYEILEEIGRGGMGAVFRARHKILNRDVAIKVLAPHLVFDQQFVARFRQEARATSSLPHPHIVHVIDIAQEGDLHYLVMDFVEGQTLSHRLRVQGKLSLLETVDLARQIGSALDFAHAHGIVHRDVKPSNILLNTKGQAFLTDFGIAKSLVGTQLTRSGTSIGTPEYMSPEQAQGAEVDGRSDLYSLAVVLYEALTGANPFHADTPVASAYRVVHTPAKPIRSVRKELPPHVEQALAKGLAKKPADRFAMAKGLAKKPADRFATADALVSALGSNATAPPASRRRLGLRPFAIAVGSCALIVALILIITNSRSAVPVAPAGAIEAIVPPPLVATSAPSTTSTQLMPTATAKPLATSTATQTDQRRVAELMAKVDLVWGKDWAQTVDLLKQARTVDPTDATINDQLYAAMYNYGQFYLNAGKVAEAITWFEFAASFKPDGTEARQALLSLTPTPSPSPTPLHSILIFDDTFQADGMRWNGQRGVDGIVGGKLSLSAPLMSGEWQGLLASPQKPIQINGDTTIQAVFNRRVRFSGLYFLIPEGYFAIIVSQGEKATWSRNPAGLGLLRPALASPWDDLGSVENLILKTNGETTFKLVFVGQQLRVYINDRLTATRTDSIFALDKKFGGFFVGNGDSFGIESIRAWTGAACSRAQNVFTCR
ncbi:MAG: serine/threonine protein kinase [Chloroflexi bacterium]|nr:serine/threonine protein kinase [Chloroflexota bacterium]